MTDRFSPSELSVLFAQIGAQLGSQSDGGSALSTLSEIAVARVPGAMHAGVTVGRDGESFRTVGATSEVVQQTDQIQYDLGSGPCVDAIIANTTFKAGDLRTDGRWPDFGERAFKTTGVVSMLSLRLYLESDLGMIAGLNMYSEKPAAFDETSETIAVLLATHGSLAVGGASAREKAHNLLIALKGSREIGIAMGIVMATRKVTRDQAFDLLRIVSQRTHRKVADLATEVADTGALPGVPHAR
jgi:hypothetical protein